MRIRTFILFAALALTACRATDLNNNNQSDQVIALDVIGATLSRGETVDLSTMENDPNGFKVCAYQANDPSGVSLIDNLSYCKSASANKWAWNPVAKPLWPEETEAYPIQFVSVYSPHTAFFSAPLTRQTLRAFEIDTKAADNGKKEIMVASKLIKSVNEGVDPVPMAFKHVLARVRFAITTGTGVTAKIQSVRLVNVDSKRNYDMIQEVYNSGSTTPVDFGYMSLANTRTVSGSDVSLTADDNGVLFMVPQSTAPWANISPWNPNSLTKGARVEVIYRLFVGAAGSPAYKDMVGYANHPTAGEVFDRVSYPLDLLSTPWSAANAYVYTIKLGTMQDNGGILVDDVFVDKDGNKTSEPVTNPDTKKPINNGTPVLGSQDAPIGFGVVYEAFKSVPDGVPVTQDDSITTLKLTPAGDWLDISSVAQTKTIKVEGGDWTSSVVGTGLTLSPESGVAGTDVTLTWAANTYTTLRTARVYFIATANGFGRKLFQTSQRGTFGMLPAGDWSNVSALGAIRKVKVMGSKWTAVVTGTGLSIDKTSGSDGDDLTLTWARNYGDPKPADRTGKVVITDIGGDSQTINTTQLGEIFMFSPVGDWSDVSSEGAEYEITITGTPKWTITLENFGGAGCSIDKTNGNNGDKIKITWASNVGTPAPATRKATLTIHGTNSLGDIVFNTTQLGGTPPAPTGAFVKIDGVNWAIGNLVATSSTAGAGGLGALKIGAPTDGGLYFCFGSLIGLRGGSVASGGTGEGTVDKAWKGRAWGGAAAYSKDNDMLIWPTEQATFPSSYFGNANDGTTVSSVTYFFSYYQAPFGSGSWDISTFDEFAVGTSLIDGGYANKGVGDPCRYYLGAPWRLPSNAEITSFNNYILADKAGRKKWSATDPIGTWLGEDPTLATKSIFIPASGYRGYGLSGKFEEVGTLGLTYSGSTKQTQARVLVSNETSAPAGQRVRGDAAPVRCVYGD